MPTDLALVWLEPIGSHAVPWVCDHAPVRLATYPDSPQGAELRLRRLDLGLSLRAAAQRLGMKALELSALERGAATLGDDDWTELGRRLRSGEVR